MSSRKPKHQLIVGVRVYTRKEIADLLGVDPTTISQWVKRGLPVLNKDEKKWFLKGQEVKKYLIKRKSGKKINLKPGEFYCLYCRAPRRAIPDSIEIKDNGFYFGKGESMNRCITVAGRCSECLTKITLFTSSDKLRNMTQEYPSMEKSINHMISFSQITDRSISTKSPCVNIINNNNSGGQKNE